MVNVKVLSYDLVKDLTSEDKVKKILKNVKKGDVVMIQGSLTNEEQTTLISSALESISGKFSGIEIAYLDSKSATSLVEKVKNSIIKIIAKDRMGTTVIGPSKIVKEIKMNPDTLEILLN